MSYSLHILRVPESKENQISADEWISCIESDPELHPSKSSNSPNGCIIATVAETEEWESLRWSNGFISANYPQSKMISKMSAIAQRLGAVIMSDDGDIWNVSENGRVIVDSSKKDSETTHNTPDQDKPLLRGEIWPYFNYDPETDPRRIIVWLYSCRPECDISLVERFLSVDCAFPYSKLRQLFARVGQDCLSACPRPRTMEKPTYSASDSEKWELLTRDAASRFRRVILLRQSKRGQPTILDKAALPKI